MPEPDLSDLLAMSKPRRLECGVKTALKSLKPADRAKLAAALVHEGVTSTAISNWLRDKNINLKDQQINRHRRKGCSCDA